MREGYVGQQESLVEDVETGVEHDQLTHCLKMLTDLPNGFRLHPKLKRVMACSRKTATNAGSAHQPESQARTGVFACLSLAGASS